MRARAPTTKYKGTHNIVKPTAPTIASDTYLLMRPSTINTPVIADNMATSDVTAGANLSDGILDSSHIAPANTPTIADKAIIPPIDF